MLLSTVFDQDICSLLVCIVLYVNGSFNLFFSVLLNSEGKTSEVVPQCILAWDGWMIC